jgi:hypothetical protein
MWLPNGESNPSYKNSNNLSRSTMVYVNWLRSLN